MFDRIAPRYDLLNRILSAGTDVRWRRACLDELGPTRGGRILDVCTGTADLLLEALRRDPAARGIGLDLSAAMLAKGAGKLRRHGLAARAALALGDAEQLPLAGASMGGAVIGFGIRNVPEPARVLREIHRALRPGARLVVLEFSMPRGLLGALYRFYFRRLLPWFGRLISCHTGAYAYLPASVARFPAPAAFAALMRDAGFEDVGWRGLTGGIACLHRGDKPA
jgi:demethylmenaquinone methyltransferase / 2-methoxy-6-polyprenyl-1,4-benzoquinol methylase